jgi:hypothetical protein
MKKSLAREARHEEIPSEDLCTHFCVRKRGHKTRVMQKPLAMKKKMKIQTRWYKKIQPGHDTYFYCLNGFPES